MPEEYFIWIDNLAQRDYFSLIMAILGISFGLILIMAGRLEESKKPPEWSNLSSVITVVLVLVMLGLVLRFYGLENNSFWHDEAMSIMAGNAVDYSSRPVDFSTIFQVSKGSAHPPGYYLFLSFWDSVHVKYLVSSEFWLRFPSAYIGLLNVLLVWIASRALGRPKIEAAIASFLIAISPFHIFHSQNVRMYEFLLFFCLLALIGYGLRKWWLLILGGALAAWTQSLGAGLFLISLGLTVIIFDRAVVRPVVLSGLAIVFLFSPWVIYGLLTQVGRISGNFWIPELSPGAFFFYVYSLVNSEFDPLSTIGFMWAVFMVLTVGLWSAWQVEKRIFMLAIVPIITCAVISLAIKPVFIDRAFIASSPMIAMAIATLISRRRLATFCLSLLVAINLLSVHYYHSEKVLWPNKQWAGEISSRYQQGDVVLYLPKLLPVWYYNRQLSSYFITENPRSPNYGFLLSNESARAMGMRLVDNPGDITGDRIWLVYAKGPATTEDQTRFFEAMTSNHEILWRKEFVNDDNSGLSGYLILLGGKKHVHGNVGQVGIDNR